MLSFFPRDVLNEILNLIESVSEGFPTYSFSHVRKCDNERLCIGNLFTAGKFLPKGGLKPETTRSVGQRFTY